MSMSQSTTPSASQRESSKHKNAVVSSVARPASQDDDVFMHRMEQYSESQNTELMTQNELTQLGDFDDNVLSPLPPQSPMNLLNTPWGRLIPCSKNSCGSTGIDLLPRQASSKTTGDGVSFLGLDNVKASDIFNEYTVGRSPKCNVLIQKPLQGDQLQDWAHAMISNRHCRIYCMLKTGEAGMSVYLEDTSGNGTLINFTTLLRRGEKRILHTGDEICLVNPTTLRKKIRSKELLQETQCHHSFIFVNVYQQQGGTLMAAARPQPQAIPSSSMIMPPPQRKGLVDVRVTANHSIRGRSSVVDVLSSSTSRSSITRRVSPRRQPPRRVEEEYDIRDLLGSGTCGEVRRAIHRHSGEQFAVKIIALAKHRIAQFDQTSAAFEAEASILQSLDHPYVVKLVDVFVSPGVAVYLVMELLHGGDLFDRIVQKGNYSEANSRKVMRRLLNAIYYLHEIKNVMHRDLKPENILCVNRESDIDVKLTDFGLAKSVSDDGLKTFCGTPQYFAPEVLRRRHTVAGRGRYGKEADMWSLGVILYILLSGMPPFDVSQGLDSVADANVEFPDDRWLGISPEAKDLVQQLLRADPRNRISVKDACKHKWILTEDGDTHTYPLNDPATSLELHGKSSSKILFPRQEDRFRDSDGQTCVAVAQVSGHDTNAVDACEAGFREPDSVSNEAPLYPTKVKSSDAPRPRDSPKAQSLNPALSAEATMHTCNALNPSSEVGNCRADDIADMKENAAKDGNKSNHLSPNRPKSAANPSSAQESVHLEASFAEKGKDNAAKEPMDARHDANVRAEKAFQDADTNPVVCKTPAQESRDVPLSLNARSNNFRALVVRSVEKENGSSTSGTSAKASSLLRISPKDKGGPKGILVTPKSLDVTTAATDTQISSRVTVANRPKAGGKKRTRKVKISTIEARAAELTEDEICSQFSDEGDSISSCGTTTDDIGSVGDEARDTEESTENTAKGNTTTAKRPVPDEPRPKGKKRRILLGRSTSRSRSAEDGTTISDEDVMSSTRIGGATQPKAGTSDTKKKEVKAKGTRGDESKANIGRRQTKLSKWFRKKVA